MELEIIMLSKINSSKSQISHYGSFVGPRLKMVVAMMMMMGT
jgi:hypothetical protein